jgi:hypothetical protein
LGDTNVTSSDLKKRAERFFLERFVEAAGLDAEIVQEREQPDFLVRFDGRLLGVEVTRLFVSHDANGVLPQAQESFSDRIVARGRTNYESSGACPAHVSVYFASRQDLRQINRDSVAQELSALVANMNLVAWKRMDWRPEHPGPLIDVISLVHALGVPEPKMAHWAVARSGWVAPVTIGVLQSRVDEKAKRLSAYQNELSENWLVIFADGMKPSQLFEVRSDFERTKVASPFNRTFFFAHPDRAVVELGSVADGRSVV